MGTHPWQRGGRRNHVHVAVTIPVFRRGGADPRAAEEGGITRPKEMMGSDYFISFSRRAWNR
jgi:hypothetical protein